MIEYYKKVVFQNYSNFEGRARRSEYWYFVLFNGIISIALYILLILSLQSKVMFLISVFLYIFYSLIIILPYLAVGVRRLHDIGKSGWNMFWMLCPGIGPILLLVWFCTDSKLGENKWGPNPKENNLFKPLY